MPITTEIDPENLLNISHSLSNGKGGNEIKRLADLIGMKHSVFLRAIFNESYSGDAGLVEGVMRVYNRLMDVHNQFATRHMPVYLGPEDVLLGKLIRKHLHAHVSLPEGDDRVLIAMEMAAAAIHRFNTSSGSTTP